MPPWPGSSTTIGRGSPLDSRAARSSWRARPRDPVVDRGRAQEGFAVDATRSSTSRAGWPSDASSTKAFSTRTGPVTSSTMREPPGITSPKRKALTRPRPRSPVLGGNWKRHLRQVDHDPVRIGEREGAHLDLRERSTTKRVCLASPPTRTSVATGESPLAASPGGLSGDRRESPASSKPSTHPARLVARFATKSQAPFWSAGPSYSNRAAWLTES